MKEIGTVSQSDANSAHGVDLEEINSILDQEIEGSSPPDPRPDCIMCLAFIDWFDEAWPADAPEHKPDFQPRKAEDILRIGAVGHGAPDFMPFCRFCAQWYMQALARFQQDFNEKNEGGKQVQGRTLVGPPQQQLLLPGMPGFKAP